jgi:predicted lipoprotein
LAVAGAVLALLVAMGFSTNWLSTEEAEAITPPPFNSQTYAAKQFPKVTAEIKEKAVDLATLAPAVAANPTEAGKKYGQDLGSGSFAYPVKAIGSVTAVDANFATLKVQGVPDGWAVRIPLAAAISGTPMRDATGSITFGDFIGQTDFQSVANQFKLLIQKNVIDKADPKSWRGKSLTVYGAWATGGPSKSFNIQPVSIELAP